METDREDQLGGERGRRQAAVEGGGMLGSCLLAPVCRARALVHKGGG